MNLVDEPQKIPPELCAKPSLFGLTPRKPPSGGAVAVDQLPRGTWWTLLDVDGGYATFGNDDYIWRLRI